MMDLSAISELREWKLCENGLYLGSSLSLSNCQQIMQNLDLKEGYKKRVIAAVLEMLHWFAGKHIRNTATIAGNIQTASPISDLNPIWLASNAELTLVSHMGERDIVIDSNFFVKYRTTIIQPEEIIRGIRIPFTNQNEHFFCYKQAQRREDDIAIVNAAYKLTLDDDNSTITGISMAYGGMAPTTILASSTMDFLKHKKWNLSTIEDVYDVLLQELKLPIGVPGGMRNFRQALALSFLHKFYWDVQNEIQGTVDRCELMKDVPMSATQIYQEVSAGQPDMDPVGRPIMHLSGQKHTTGQAIYCDDVQVEGSLHMAFVLSQHAHAKLLNVDATAALAMPGVIAYIDQTDAGKNCYGIMRKNKIFATDEVHWFGQPIGAIVAEDPNLALKAARKVQVQYQVMDPIVSIEDAIKADSYYNTEMPLFVCKKRQPGGKPVPIDWNKCENTLAGSIRVGGQEHFYLEPHCCIAIPGEDDELNIICSTQHHSAVQADISHALDVPMHKVVVSVRRIGGGFGGKETASVMVALPCAIAAYKLRKPVRCVLERCDDMIMTGTRHPFLSKFKVGFDTIGKITAYESDLYSNAGCVIDLSQAVMVKALCQIDNAYKIPELIARGHVCYTNIQPSTAFRGFGAPQAMLITEGVIDAVAEYLNIPSDNVREMNLYEEGDLTHLGLPLNQCNVRRCWTECKQLADYQTQKMDVDNFNSQNSWIKRGLCLLPTKFSIAYELPFMNQAGSLVHIYLDGTVLISHSGMEMGQGLHTKICQIASRVLGVPLSNVHIQDSSTNKVPNVSATAASVSSDINGMAVKKACDILNERLKPYKLKLPKGEWVDWVNAAYLDCVSLSTTGYWNMPNLEPYDFEKGTGNPFIYTVYGVACSQVQIDCLTGNHKVLRTDIVMDVGDSLNPAIDIGQIEGAFVQGYGLFTMEELKYSPKGIVYTRGPGTYKIPSADDIPRRFNVKLLKGSSNKHAIFSSKAVGEPPLFLGASVFYAIKDAIKSARKEAGHSPLFHMDSPATPENIRLCCGDSIVQMMTMPTDDPMGIDGWLTKL